MVDLWGRRWTRDELLARVGGLEQFAGVQLVEAGDVAERGVRLLCFRIGAGFDFEVLVDARRFDARSRGELQHLAPGEQRRYLLEIGALLGRDAIDAFTSQVAALSAFRSRTPASTGGRT